MAEYQDFRVIDEARQDIEGRSSSAETDDGDVGLCDREKRDIVRQEGVARSRPEGKSTPVPQTSDFPRDDSPPALEVAPIVEHDHSDQGELEIGGFDLLSKGSTKSENIQQLREEITDLKRQKKFIALELSAVKRELEETKHVLADSTIRLQHMLKRQGRFDFFRYCEAIGKDCCVCYGTVCAVCSHQHADHSGANVVSGTCKRFKTPPPIRSHAYSESVLKTACRGDYPAIWNASSCKSQKPSECCWRQQCCFCDRTTAQVEKSFNEIVHDALVDPNNHYPNKQTNGLQRNHADLFHVYTFRALCHNINVSHYRPHVPTEVSCNCSSELFLSINTFLDRAHYLSCSHCWVDKGHEQIYINPSDAGMLFHLATGDRPNHFIEFPCVVKVYFDASEPVMPTQSISAPSLESNFLPGTDISTPNACSPTPTASSQPSAVYNRSQSDLHDSLPPHTQFLVPRSLSRPFQSGDSTPVAHNSTSSASCAIIYAQIPPFYWAFPLVDTGGVISKISESTRTAEEFVTEHHPQAKAEAARLSQYFPQIVTAVNRVLAQKRGELFVEGSPAKKWQDDELDKLRQEMEEEQRQLEEKEQTNKDLKDRNGKRRAALEKRRASVNEDGERLMQKEQRLKEQQSLSKRSTKSHQRKADKDYDTVKEQLEQWADEKKDIVEEEQATTSDEVTYVNEVVEINDFKQELIRAGLYANFAPKLIYKYLPSCCLEIHCTCSL